MTRKHNPGDIIGNPREAEIVLAQGASCVIPVSGPVEGSTPF